MGTRFFRKRVAVGISRKTGISLLRFQLDKSPKQVRPPRRLHIMSPQALEHLYDRHAPALFAFLLHLTRGESDTRDALQEVFVRIAKRPELLVEVRSERDFLLRLSHNLAIDLMRRRATRRRAHDALGLEPASPFAPSADPDQAAFRDQLATAMSSLPDEQRAVVHLKLWEGLTFEAIASLLSIPPNTAASRYRYGLDKLREHLRPLYNEIQ